MTTRRSAAFSAPAAAARWTKGLLMATLTASAVGVVSGVLQVQLLARAASGTITDDEAAANDAPAS